MKKLFFVIIYLCFTLILSARVSKTVNINAGGLLNALSPSEKTTITDLTVTGAIDATDFVTMRDKMPLLAVLDLNGVKIEAYSGAWGTNNTGFITCTYPANTIPDYAFFDQYNDIRNSILTSVTVSPTVIEIGNYAFYYCSHLTSAYIQSSFISIGDGAFEWCTHLTTVTFPSTAIIPSVATYIGDYAFYKCINLISMTIPASTNSIGKFAFSNCSGLTSIIIPSSVSSIEEAAFEGCSGLTSINILSKVAMGELDFSNMISIGASAFSGCIGLTSISIPPSVTSIGGGAFSGCSGLTSIYVFQPYPSYIKLGNTIFSNVNKTTCILYVPAGSKSYDPLIAYRSAEQWKDFINIIRMTSTLASKEAVDLVNLYPNPIIDGFVINGLKGIGILTISDLSGKILFTKHITGNEYITANKLPNGVYILRITIADGIIVRKVIKK